GGRGIPRRARNRARHRDERGAALGRGVQAPAVGEPVALLRGGRAKGDRAASPRDGRARRHRGRDGVSREARAGLEADRRPRLAGALARVAEGRGEARGSRRGSKPSERKTEVDAEAVDAAAEGLVEIEPTPAEAAVLRKRYKLGAKASVPL